MIPFQRLTLAQKEAYDKILFSCPPRGCEYSFANLCLWGRQQAAFLHGCVAFFSHFYGRSVYPYPIGSGDKKAVIEEILLDARERGIPCRFTGMTDADRQKIQELLALPAGEVVTGGQVGLRNVNQRLNLIYADRGRLTVREIHPGSILAQVYLPQ